MQPNSDLKLRARAELAVCGNVPRGARRHECIEEPEELVVKLDRQEKSSDETYICNCSFKPNSLGEVPRFWSF